MKRLYSDKVSDLYRLKPKIYDRLLPNELCNKYRIVDDIILIDLNFKAKNIISKLDIA